MNRIDWHRFARTGDLATVEYREERAVTIVFVIDDRASVHRDAPGGGPDSYDLTLYAASRGVVASLEDGNRTGLVTLSGDTWTSPAVVPTPEAASKTCSRTRRPSRHRGRPRPQDR